MPELWDYVENSDQWSVVGEQRKDVPIRFLLMVAHYLGVEPLDNYSVQEPLFDLQEGRYVAAPSETTLSPHLSEMLHHYLCFPLSTFHFPLNARRDLIDALIAYYQLHLSGFRQFHSHEILHTILK